MPWIYLTQWGISLPYWTYMSRQTDSFSLFHTSPQHIHTDLLTCLVPVALLSEKELGDNLIDFILSCLGLSDAWRRHFNCKASPQSPNLPLISPRQPQRLGDVSGLLLIDVSACFMSIWDMTALTQCWFQSACHTAHSLTAGESKRRHNLWGCHWLRSGPALSLTGWLSSLLMKMFHSHLKWTCSMPPWLMNSIEEKRETNREGKKCSFCQIGEARRENDPWAKGSDTASIPLGVRPAGPALAEDYFSTSEGWLLYLFHISYADNKLVWSGSWAAH